MMTMKPFSKIIKSIVSDRKEKKNQTFKISCRFTQMRGNTNFEVITLYQNF